MSNFLGKGTDDEVFKFHFLGWKKICKPLMCGGLGFWHLCICDQALRDKWSWHFTVEDGLWRSVVAARFECT